VNDFIMALVFVFALCAFLTIFIDKPEE